MAISASAIGRRTPSGVMQSATSFAVQASTSIIS